MAWQLTHTALSSFSPFVAYIKFSRLSKNLKRKSTLSVKWEWPQALPSGEVINKVLAPLMTTMKSHLETRNWQQMKTINSLNRKAKREKIKSNELLCPLVYSVQPHGLLVATSMRQLVSRCRRSRCRGSRCRGSRCTGSRDRGSLDRGSRGRGFALVGMLPLLLRHSHHFFPLFF